MTTITDDLPARLLHEEHVAWQAVCAGRGGHYYAREMTPDAVVVLAGLAAGGDPLAPGPMFGRDEVLAAFSSLPAWDGYEIHEPRLVRLGMFGGVLVYRAVARRGDRATELAVGTTYLWQDGGWKVACHQQAPGRSRQPVN